MKIYIYILLITTSVLAFAQEEQMSYLDNGIIHIGVNLDIGGAITYLAETKTKQNMINSHDWGRQIQMSFYSGPVPFTPNGKQPSKTWAGLGWNPIQSGDYAGNRSKVLAHRNDGKEQYVKCAPMQWPLDNEPGECTFETWIKLDSNRVLVRSRLNNSRKDKMQYPGRSQELPAIYTNGSWYRLMTYDGDKPFTGGELRQVKKKWSSAKDLENGSPWEHWMATENWAALVNDELFGVGVWKPGSYNFVGGFFGKPGSGGVKDAPTGYISPLEREILDHDIVYTYDYTLIVGKLDEIRQYVYNQVKSKPQDHRPDYRFKRDRQHWVYRNAVDTGLPINGALYVKLEQNNPQLIGPAGFWQASNVPELYIRAELHHKKGEGKAKVFWKTFSDPNFDNKKSVSFKMKNDGIFHTYKVNLAVNKEYSGAIVGLRIDPVSTGQQGDYVKIEFISWRE